MNRIDSRGLNDSAMKVHSVPGNNFQKFSTPFAIIKILIQAGKETIKT
jgi:hypothetical protein